MRFFALGALLCACDPAQIAARATCGLSGAAFCHGVEAPSPMGRAGPLDEQRWQFSRFTHLSNVPQNQIVSWEPARGTSCRGVRDGLVPPEDIFLCDGRIHDVLFGGTLSFAMHDLALRQPFDFAGRTGTVTFELAGSVKTFNGWWPEIWLTEAPRQIPEVHESTGFEPTLERGVGLELKGEADCGDDRAHTAVSKVFVVEGYAVTTLVPSQRVCFDVGEGVRNRFTLRVSQSRIELEVTPPGGSARVVLSEVVALPFSRAYLHLEQFMWDAASSGNTLVWSEVGFDGPALPAWSVVEVPDALVPAGPLLAAGSINTGYPMVDPFVGTLSGVRLEGKTEALLAFTASLVPPWELQVRWNDGAWRTVADPSPGITHHWRAMLLPVSLSELRDGENTVELKTTASDGFAHVANVELLLR